MSNKEEAMSDIKILDSLGLSDAVVGGIIMSAYDMSWYQFFDLRDLTLEEEKGKENKQHKETRTHE
jgi:hypothetical protein